MSNLRMIFRTDHDHFTGSPLAPLEMIQYGDFQCKDCGEVYPVIKALVDSFGPSLKFVYRHYPVPCRNPLALEAALATEAAALQGKFWYMHDMIYENQSHLRRGSFAEFAKAIELDMAEYENCRSRRNLVQKVITDFEGGVKSGVNTSPSFYINGTRHDGFNDFDSLNSALQNANYFQYGMSGRTIGNNR